MLGMKCKRCGSTHIIERSVVDLNITPAGAIMIVYVACYDCGEVWKARYLMRIFKAEDLE